MTPTESEFDTVPPAPEHVSVNVVSVDRLLMLCDPEVDLFPVHPPVAVHDVASVELQLSVVEPPGATTDGSAENVSVGNGGGFTITITLELTPSHVKVYVFVDVRLDRRSEPDVDRLPVHEPDDVHDVAFVLDQFNVVEPLYATVVGVAVSVTVGGTVTVTDCDAVLPPALEHVRVNVLLDAVSDVLASLPEVPFAPIQAPDAVHDVALVLDHVSCDVPPLVTVDGLAVSDTVGMPVWAATVIVTFFVMLPPSPLHVSV